MRMKEDVEKLLKIYKNKLDELAKKYENGEISYHQYNELKFYYNGAMDALNLILF